MKARSLTSIGRDDRTNRQIALLLAIGFFGLAGATGTAFWVQRINQHNARGVAHTLDLVARINAFSSWNERAETARRGYLLQPADSFRFRMDEAQEQRDSVLEAIDELTRDSPSQNARASELRRLVVEVDVLQGQSVTGIVGVRESLVAHFDADRAVDLTRQIRDKAAEMLEEEQLLLTRRQQDQNTTIFRFNVLLVLTTLLVVALSATTLSLIRRNLADLRASRNDLNTLNEELEDLVDLRTDALRRANAEIHRFAYIVSHDLRAPLVNVMGFTAELETARATIHQFAEQVDREAPGRIDRDTRVAIEDDLPEAIDFIRRSTQKMDRLINSILKLSREGRRTLTPETIDLGALVSSITDSLRHRAGTTGTVFCIDAMPTIVTDRLALEQILSNLIENALKYLRPDVPGEIAVSAATEPGRIVIAVSDNGRGIEPRDHERIFELFRRSGTQDQPGEGIGLAHVRALAYRLGGTVDVESTPGAGSTFRLALPLEWRPGDNHA